MLLMLLQKSKTSCLGSGLTCSAFKVKSMGKSLGVLSLHFEGIFALDSHLIRSVHPMGCLMLDWTGSNFTAHNTVYTGSRVVTVWRVKHGISPNSLETFGNHCF